MSKEIAKDMTGALTKVDEKVSVFKKPEIVKENKSEFAYPSTSLYVESMPK